MTKTLIWKGRAKAQLRAIDEVTRVRILHALTRMIATGEGDIKRLRGIEPPEFRLRVGDYRVRFHNQEDRVEVLSVKHRREAYR